jgi:hypothetical protein
MAPATVDHVCLSVIRIRPELIYQIRYAGSVTLMQQPVLKIWQYHGRLCSLARSAEVPKQTAVSMSCGNGAMGFASRLGKNPYDASW